MSKTAQVASLFLLTALWASAPLSADGAVEKSTEVVAGSLNGLEIVIDAATGSILRLSYPGPGTMLDTAPDSAGIVGLSCPVEKLPSLRLASRHSPTSKITKTEDQIVIHWDNLSASRMPAGLAGGVSATVTMKAAADGRSVTMSCHIDNQSDNAISQVFFPDFSGLVAFAGRNQTEFRTGGKRIKPFADLCASPPEMFYPENKNVAKFTSGGVHSSEMIGRWMDFGSLRGGFCLFPRRWGFDPRAVVMLHLWETNKKLRLTCTHDVNITKGGTWESGEYCLTPHNCGWAKGMDPYRAWVARNIKRAAPVPDHIRKTIGFRSVWMCRRYPADPDDAVFLFRNLPRLAKESKEHGLHEMVAWHTHVHFELPLPPFHAHLGGDEEFVKAVAECKKLGVNLVPLISVCAVTAKTAERYGTTVNPAGGWTYHPEMIPRFNPPYATSSRVTLTSSKNPIWRKDVLDSCKGWIDMGVPSLCWDVLFIKPPPEPLLTVLREIREYSRQRDPQSTLSAEELYNLEISSDYLDYTWNWYLYKKDLQPITSAFPGPRINANIDASPEEVKCCFVRNRFMNLQPRRPDDVNGSDLIENHPELSRALKQCARLRAQFLPYFVDGTFIGDCILSEPCSDAIVAGYVLPDKLLVVVLNTAAGKREVAFPCDPRPWLESPAGKYEIQKYDGEGKLYATAKLLEGSIPVTTGALEHLGISLFEIIPK